MTHILCVQFIRVPYGKRVKSVQGEGGEGYKFAVSHDSHGKYVIVVYARNIKQPPEPPSSGSG